MIGGNLKNVSKNEREALFIGQTMDSLIDGQIYSFCPDQHGGEDFNPNNAKQTHAIFVKL